MEQSNLVPPERQKPEGWRPSFEAGSMQVLYKPIWSKYWYGLLIPFFFLILHLANVSLVSPNVSRAIVNYIAVVAPSIPQHIEVLSEQGRIADVQNYPVFLVVVFGFGAIVASGALVVFKNNWKIALPPHFLVLLLILFFWFLYYDLFFLGHLEAVRNFRSLFALYFDDVGLFYFPLFLLVVGLPMTAMKTILSILHSIVWVYRIARWRFDEAA